MMKCITRLVCYSLVFFGTLCIGPAVFAEDMEGDQMTAGEAMDLLDQYYELGDITSTNEDNTIPLPNSIQPDEFYRAKVITIVRENTEELFDGFTEETQEVEVEIISGPHKGDVLSLVYGGLVSIDKYQKVAVGDIVVLVKHYTINGTEEYFITEPYRVRALLWVLVGFVLLAIIFGRKKGVGSILGLGFSIAVLILFIVPKIISGSDPLMITIVGTCVIAAVALFLAHGCNKRTLVAFISTMITLLLALGMSQLIVHMTHLFGKGTEEAFFLQSSGLGNINLRGLLLAGIVIGTLGVLDDITTAQTAVVGELRQANPSFSMKELYRRALIVGREHIASLVNTLVLAYAGSAMPLFLLFSLNTSTPAWVTLNSEMIAEEIIRTIIGSAALILAVPITTILAAYMLRHEKILERVYSSHTHTQ